MNTISNEFPNFPIDSLPAIPDNWIPIHWHNDACPSWLVAGSAGNETDVRVFIDYPDPDDRELQACPRYSVSFGHAIRAATGSEDGIDSDDWSAILAAVCASTQDFGPPTLD